MKIVSNNIEAKLVEILRAIKGDAGGYYALHFHLSMLQEHYRSEFQIRIAVNILNDIFREAEGSILISGDGDIFIIYHGQNKSLLDKAIFQLRYLFVDDPLSYNSDGSENDAFCAMFDLMFQWRPFYRFCMERLEFATQALVAPPVEMVDDALEWGPLQLARVIDDLSRIDFGYALRRQPICVARKGQKIRPVFHEVYINIGHLQRLLNTETNLLTSRWLFKYLTEVLDQKVMELIAERPRVYMDRSISLNLNVETILSPEFMVFHDKINGSVNSGLMVEMHVADVFLDLPAFREARTLLDRLGHRVCLDGLTNDSFVQVDRHRLGFDLAKLRWNADMAGDLTTDKNKQLAEAVMRCGSNRMVLCRCDSHHAIEYGHRLGISLFQGRYPDRVIDPDAMIIN